MNKRAFSYSRRLYADEERIRAYLEMPELDRLRWLEELCVFTNMFRQAPEVVRDKPETGG